LKGKKDPGERKMNKVEQQPWEAEEERSTHDRQEFIFVLHGKKEVVSGKKSIFWNLVTASTATPRFLTS
jgi:hypothetical protein